ncbi:hypothetical protein ACPA9J_06645 [Pseudomonas aeruginosa]
MPAKLRYLAAPALRETASPGGGDPQRQRLPAAPRHPEYLLGNSFVASGHLRGVMPGESSNWHWAPTRASASNASWSSAIPTAAA